MKPLLASLALFAALVVPATAHAALVDAGSVVPVVATSAPDAAVLPVVDVPQLVGAFGAKDWQVCVAALLGLVAFAIRRFTPETSFAHTRGGAAAIAMVLAAIGVMVPQLSAHSSWLASLVTGVLAAVMALAAMATPRPASAANLAGTVPDGPVLDDSVPVVGVRMLCFFPGCKELVQIGEPYCTKHARPPASSFKALKVGLVLALLLPLGAGGCAAFASQPVALQRAERDLFACATPAVQAAIVKFAPVAIDALTGEDVAWRAALVDLEREGVNATVCTVAHLLYDALGVDGVKAIAAADLEAVVEHQLLLADAGGVPPLPDPPHRRVLRRGLVVLQDARRARAGGAR